MEKLETYEQFLKIKPNPLSIVMAKTETCTVCRPVLFRLEQLLQHYADVPFYTIDISKVDEFRGQQLIFTVPTILIFAEGQEILRESRFVDFDCIKRLLDLATETH